MLCEQIEGKTLEEVREMNAQDMLDLLKVQLTASRQKCGLLGFKVLKTMKVRSGCLNNSPKVTRDSTNT